MIELSSTSAFTLYLGITLALILGIWIYHHVTGSKKKLSLIEKELLVCEYCQCVYLAGKYLKVTQCPQCQSFNKSNSYVPK